MADPHMHPCTRCGQPFECGGAWEQNYDGIPVAICVSYHVDRDTECVVCTITTWCAHCGSAPSVGEWDGDKLCLACARERAPELSA